MKGKFKKIIIVASIFILLYVVFHFFLPVITGNEFRLFVKDLGALGPIAIIGYVVLSHIFAPVSGTPGAIVSLAIFGVYKTILFIYLASIISAAINFYIARKFGRHYVVKFVGKKTMQEVDEFVAVSGGKVLILARLFGFPVFDVLSYAYGLTTMPFKKYYAITLFFSLFPNIIFTYLYKDIDFTKPTGALLWLGGLLIIGVVFTFVLKRSLKRKGL